MADVLADVMAERKKCILVAVRFAIYDMIQQRALASEIHSRIHAELEIQLNENDSNEFRATVTTEAVARVDTMLLNAGYYLGNPPAENQAGDPPVEDQAGNAPGGSLA